MLLCNILAPEFMQKSMEDQLRELFRGTSQSGCLPSRDLLQSLCLNGEPSFRMCHCSFIEMTMAWLSFSNLKILCQIGFGLDVIPHFCLRILEKLPSGEPSSFWQSFVLDTSHVDLDELVRDVCEVVDGPKSTELKVWLSFVKLDDKLPTVSSVQRLLYESPEGWAMGEGELAWQIWC